MPALASSQEDLQLASRAPERIEDEGLGEQCAPCLLVYGFELVKVCLALLAALLISVMEAAEAAIAAYRELLRLMREDWGIAGGEDYAQVERAIHKLQS